MYTLFPSHFCHQFRTFRVFLWRCGDRADDQELLREAEAEQVRHRRLPQHKEGRHVGLGKVSKEEREEPDNMWNWSRMELHRGKIRLIENNAKFRYLKKLS